MNPFYEYLLKTSPAKVKADLAGTQLSRDQIILDRYGIKNPAPVSQVSPKVMPEGSGERFDNLKQAYVSALNTPGLNPQIIALLQRQMMEQQEPEMIEVEPEPSIYDRILRHFDDSEE